MPVSAMSAESSGGVASKAFFTDWTIIVSGSLSASRMSLLFKVNTRGTPSCRLWPRTFSSRGSSCL